MAEVSQACLQQYGVVDVDTVAEAIRHAHAETVAPYFRDLKAGEIEYKSAGEVVTVADRECELVLGGLLKDVRDVPVLGEEGATTNPALLDAMPSWESFWLVDPIDGTASFAEGDPHYAVMVAYVSQQQTMASWIYQPELDHMAIAVRGAGATFDGLKVVTPMPNLDPTSWSGVIKDRFLPDQVKDSVDRAGRAFAERHSSPSCAGIEYPALVAGQHSFLLYWRTLPWDHAPGVLYAEEAGCLALRPGGDHYVSHDGRSGLIVAPRAIAATVANRLFGSAVTESYE